MMTGDDLAFAWYRHALLDRGIELRSIIKYPLDRLTHVRVTVGGFDHTVEMPERTTLIESEWLDALTRKIEAKEWKTY